MIAAVLVLLAAQAAAAPPSPTPTATPPINILRANPNSTGAVPTGSLADFAKRIKLKLPEGQPRVLTNESVKQLAEGIELTTTIGGGPLPRAVGRSDQEGKKAMWQQRYRDAVSRVATLEARIKRLEGEANRLEQEFYARDNPVERDTQIKPAWDKALADLQAARDDLADARKRPDEVLNAARRDGALPGWFRGIEEGAPEAPAPRQGSAASAGAQARPEPTPTPTVTPRPRVRPVGPS
jgi:TolA-binding protein